MDGKTMRIDRIKALVFTGAGTTRVATERFVAACGVPGEVADITPAGSAVPGFASHELAVFAVPSYGGRVPAPALERFARCEGSVTPAVLIVTYGNRAVDDTFIELADCVRAHGFVPVACLAVVAHHSLMVNVAVGRPDTEDLSAVDAAASRVMTKLAASADAGAAGLFEIPGNRPYRDFGGVAFHPEADPKRCTSCGACAAACPVRAIPLERPYETDAGCCISCMRCIAACPAGARKIAGGDALAQARAAFAIRCAERQKTYALV